MEAPSWRIVENYVFVVADCAPISGSKVRLECKNDVLSVIWPTDLTYNATVTEIPPQLSQTLTNRLIEESQHPILELVIFTINPPLVFES